MGTLGFQQLEPRLAPAALPVNMIMVPVGNPGNAAHASTGYGRVTNAFQIGKYEVTIGEYAAFLNAVAASDANGLYSLAMELNEQAAAYDKTSAGIERTGSPGSYVYTVIGPEGVAPAGADDPGAYDVSGSQALAGNPPSRNAVKPNTGATLMFFLPLENQWHKAAFYSQALKEAVAATIASRPRAMRRRATAAAPTR